MKTLGCPRQAELGTAGTTTSAITTRAIDATLRIRLPYQFRRGTPSLYLPITRGRHPGGFRRSESRGGGGGSRLVYVQSRCPESLHEFIESALAAAIANALDTPQDFDARNFRILAQPLGDLRRELRHYGRATARLWSPLLALPRRHLTEPSMAGLQGKFDTGIEVSKDQSLLPRCQERAWRIADRVDHSGSTSARCPSPKLCWHPSS